MKTDDVLKALVCCGIRHDCSGCCPMLGKRDCMTKLYVESMHVIKRLYKEINLTQQEQYTNGRTDGIREFVERLKRRHLRLRPCFGIVRCCLSENDIDHLAKEMTEDTK